MEVKRQGKNFEEQEREENKQEDDQDDKPSVEKKSEMKTQGKCFHKGDNFKSTAIFTCSFLNEDMTK
jgi:hypothetical protein